MARRPDRSSPALAPATEREHRLLQQVAILAQRLLSAHPEDLDREIEECLQQAAAVAGADRSFLTVFGRRGEEPANYEWIRRGMEAQLPYQHPDAARHYPWATGRIIAGESIVCVDPAKLPNEAAHEREQLIRRGVRSLLTLPIKPGEHVIGYQSFECLWEPRNWSESEISLLRVITEIFASSVVARRTEGALRTSETRFRAIAENAPQLIAELGPDGEVLYMAPRVVDLLGYPAEEFTGHAATSFFHPEDSALVAELEAALGRGQKARIEARVRHADGNWRWFDITAQTFATEAGEARVVVVADDVTEGRQLREALRESQAQLLQSQKMEAVGRLAGGVAHDFNNLLLVIGGNVQEALEDERLPRSAREAARDALDAVDRAASLTRQLLSFSRRDLLHPRAVDLNDVIGSMEPLLDRLVGEQITLHVEVSPEPTIVRNDRGQLEQVLVNLVVNGRDAMPSGGEIFLSTETRSLDGDTAHLLGLAEGGEHHVLIVRDTGEGVAAGTADHIFEPFYTTKEPGQGTGLGLSIVYGVAHQAGGTVRVVGEPGTGATFEVILPASELDDDDLVDEVDETPAPARGRLLLVEDEDAVRRLVTRMLERHGYEVEVAGDGAQALRFAAQPGESVDLLISDVVMPGMGGPELARRLRTRWPELRVLFVSGYPRDFRPGDAPDEHAFLAKPFSQDQLLNAVAAQIDRKSG
ncbi:MAG: response regulator [Deltaproteobacteria bacterium]|nr:response regulator [Deltaproteobacteria bacterium]MBW2447184.1 response regulator [Deltaproteobacteria bacterium]